MDQVGQDAVAGATDAVGQSGFDEKCRFIIDLGKASHAFGSSTIRLEAFLAELAEAVGIEGRFHATPNEIVFAFSEHPGDWQKICLSTTNGGMDLARQLLLDGIADDFISGKASVAEAKTRLADIQNASDPYGGASLAFGYVALGAGIAGLFGGSWTDITVSCLLSLVVFAMVMQGTRIGGRIDALTPLTTAFVAGICAAVIKHFIPDLNYVVVTLAAIIVLIPGYTISMGVGEIANSHIVSGLTNLVNGTIYLAKQIIGAWSALAIVNAFWPLSDTTGTAVDPVWLWGLVPAIFIGLIIVYQTPYRYFLWAFLCSGVGYVGVVLGSDLIDKNIGNVIGAALVGMFANLWERKTGKPASIVLAPAITVLVSGSVGFRGLFARVEGDAAGTGEFMQMFIVAITLTAGLVVANTIIKPKASL